MTRPIRLLQGAAFLSQFDRMVIAPLLLVIAADLATSIEAVAATATTYFIGYGLMQLVWAVASDRLGRVRTLRLALTVGALACLASAVAPGVITLTIARILAGAAFAAAVPATLTYVGDTVPLHRRHAPLADIMTATAVGMAVATLVAAVLAQYSDWRLAFLGPGLLTALLVIALRQLPEPERATDRPAVLASIRMVVGQRWAVTVIAFSFIEGAVLVGPLPLLPTVLQLAGMGTAASGLVTASYGAAVIAFATLVKPAARQLSNATLMAIGGGSAVLAFGALLLDAGFAGVLAASVLLAVAWAFLHSTLQKWATEVVPASRAIMVALFASALFLGGSLGTGLGTPFVAVAHYVPYFSVGLLTTAALTVAVVLAQRRYSARH